jgi:hypothetical protein
MKYCLDRQETLWLDVYGELAPENRSTWEEHLEGCKLCRQERDRLLGLFEKVKTEMNVPSLSHLDAAALRNAVTRRIKDQHDRSWWRKPFLGGYIKPIHALATCCLLLLAFGWFGLKGSQYTTPVKTVSSIGLKEQLIVQDLDLLENLDMLEEMETLEKLDQLMRRGEIAI